MADKKKENGNYVDLIYTTAVIGTFVIISLCYGGVCWKIRRTSAMISSVMGETDKVAQRTRVEQNNKAAKTMCLFVLAYILQWVLYIFYSIYQFFWPPPLQFLAVVVFFCNMGGVFNFLAYSFSRRQNMQQRKAVTVSVISSEKTDSNMTGP